VLKLSGKAEHYNKIDKNFRQDEQDQQEEKMTNMRTDLISLILE
jgi:hypothetical protein